MKTSKSSSRLALTLLVALAVSISGQTTPKYSYDAQKKFIPAELGEVYLGMPFAELVKKFDFSRSDVSDYRFGYLPVMIPFEKGNIREVYFEVHGLSESEIKPMLRQEKGMTKEVNDGKTFEFEKTFDRLDPAKAVDKGFLYQITVHYKPEFDLKSHVIKTFGNNGTVHDPDDEYHFYDIQWAPSTKDGLKWLIRSFHEGEGHSIQLIGRIPNTRWDPNP